MKVLAAGATGFIGRALITELSRRGHEVVALARNPAAAAMVFPTGVTVEAWDGSAAGEWCRYVEGADAVINLAGTSIAGGRWTKERKKRIRDSRMNATRAIVTAIRSVAKRPKVLLNASAVGYYGMRGEGIVTEKSEPGSDFLAETCRLWESEALLARESGIRVVLPRLGVVLAADGGALKKMVLPFKFFIGGPLGSGKQWYPWIHRDDAVAAMAFLLEHAEANGPVNLVAPGMATMAEVSHELGRTLARPSWMPVPAVALRLLLGEMAGMILEGRQVFPERLIELGFQFRYPGLREAMGAIQTG